MMRRLHLYITLYIFGLLCVPVLLNGSKLDDIKEYKRKISETEKVNNLYSIRYGLGRISNESDLKVDEKRELMGAFKSLSIAFAERNHFRNSADVWFDFLKIEKSLREEYGNYLKDSVAQNYRIIADAEMSQLAKLEMELKKLHEQQKVINQIRNKYYTFGGLALVIVLIIFGYLLWQQLSRIREFRRRLNENRQRLLDLYRDSVESRMAIGGIAFTREMAETGSSLLEEMGNLKPADIEWEQLINQLHSLKKTIDS